MVSSGSVYCQLNQKTVTVIIRKSQCAVYFHGITEKTCLFKELNCLALKEDNHCGSVLVRKWNDQHSCRPVTGNGMDGTFKLRYFARCTVHLITVQKVNDIADIFILRVVF
jgi:hypothetical protein